MFSVLILSQFLKKSLEVENSQISSSGKVADDLKLAGVIRLVNLHGRGLSFKY